MRRRVGICLVLIFLFGFPAVLGAGDKTIVAVFDVEAKRIKLSGSLRDGLSAYLATKLAGTSKYQVVPRDQLKKRLLQEKKRSYKQCYDQKCQIEMGRELAAEKTLSAQVIKIGNVCTLNIALYDLKKAATESAASVRGKCGEEGLLDSIDKAVSKLAGVEPAPTVPARPEVYKTKTGPAAIEWIYSKPAGIEFSKCEITVAQYRSCVEAGSCEKPKSKSDSKYCSWGYSGRDNHPINCVDWNQARSFCEWAGGRLPTEDEWYAEASNGGKRAYPWGDAGVTCDYAIWGDLERTDGCGRKAAWPVCSKRRGNSVSGLCDLSGNLWEWTSSWYDNEHKYRVVRGGAWFNEDPGYFRASSRGRGDPTDRVDGLGFRCGR